MTDGYHHKKEKKKTKTETAKNTTRSITLVFFFILFFFTGLCAILLILRTENEKRGKMTAHDYGFIISASHDPVSALFFEKNRPMMTEKTKRGQSHGSRVRAATNKSLDGF